MTKTGKFMVGFFVFAMIMLTIGTWIRMTNMYKPKSVQKEQYYDSKDYPRDQKNSGTVIVTTGNSYWSNSFNYWVLDARKIDSIGPEPPIHTFILVNTTKEMSEAKTKCSECVFRATMRIKVMKTREYKGLMIADDADFAEILEVIAFKQSKCDH